jgi:two-component system, NarL family, nitrate/nitrite response regulator NarL
LKHPPIRSEQVPDTMPLDLPSTRPAPFAKLSSAGGALTSAGGALTSAGATLASAGGELASAGAAVARATPSAAIAPAANDGAPAQRRIQVALLTEDPLVHAALRARLAATGEIGVVEDPSRATVLIWDPPPLGEAELPSIPHVLDARTGEAPIVIALIGEDTDPMPLLAAGVRGLVRRNVDAERLRATILAAQLGLTVLDEDPADALVAAWSPAAEAVVVPPIRDARERLTPRESEVLELLADGLSNRAIAQQLGISAHTVKFHVDALLDKLSARSRTQVVVKAVRQGLLALV